MVCPNKECDGKGTVMACKPVGLTGEYFWDEVKCITCDGKGFLVDDEFKVEAV